MDTIVFGEYTVQDLVVLGAIVVVVLVGLTFFSRLLRSKPESAQHQKVRCPGCGWQGQISKIAGRCPKCNQPLGDRRANPGG